MDNQLTPQEISMKRNYRWDDIRIFNACMAHQSLSATANALGMQQSTLSRRIAILEESLGGALFHRTSEGIMPTALAHKLAHDAAAMEQHHLALEHLAAGHEHTVSGKVKLALIEPIALYMVVPHLDDLAKKHPQLSIELISNYTSTDLTRQEAELALRLMRPTAGDLIATKLMTFPIKAMVTQQYVDMHGLPSLERGRWVNVNLPWLNTPEQRWYEQHVKIDPWLQTNSYVLATQAIAAGQCVGITTAITETLFDVQWVDLNLEVPMPPPMELWLVTHQAMRKVPRIDATWRWLCQLFEQYNHAQ